jgi:hypothetical protein
VLLGSCAPAPMSTARSGGESGSRRRGGDRERGRGDEDARQARDEDAGRASRRGHHGAGECEAGAGIEEGDEMVAGARAPLVAQGLGKGIARGRAAMA